MSHYNYCGICQGFTLHTYEPSGGYRWEICQEGMHSRVMSEVIGKLSAIVQGKVN